MDPKSTILKTIYGAPGNKFIDIPMLNIPSEGTHTFTLEVTLRPNVLNPHISYLATLDKKTKEAMSYGGRRRTKRRKRRKTKQRRRRRTRKKL